MDVLCVLAKCQGQVVSRGDLIDRVWGVQFGGDESLSRAISKLRKTFSLAGASDVYIETIPKRGYRLTQPASGFSNTAEISPIGSSIAEEKSRTLSDTGYSLAVIPIECRTGIEDEILANEIGWDLVSMLSREPNLRVAPYDASLTGETRGSDFVSLGEKLNVRYLISGALANRGDAMTLRISLIDTTTNALMMSWRFKDDLARFQADLDEFILDLSVPILSEIQISEASNAHLLEQGRPRKFWDKQKSDFLQSLYMERRSQDIIVHLKHQIAKDADNAAAHASLAVQLAQNFLSGWIKNRAETIQSAKLHLAKALELAPRDAHVLAAGGIVAAMLADYEDAIHYLERANRRNPNDPHVLALLGWQICFLHGDKRGIDMICKAEARAPHHPRFPMWSQYRGMSWARLDNYEKAAAGYRDTTERNPKYHLGFLALGGTLASLGELDEAQKQIERGLKLAPHYTQDAWRAKLDRLPRQFSSKEAKENYFTALRKVWPE